MMKTILRKVVAGLVAKLIVMVLWAILNTGPAEPVLVLEPAFIWVQVHGVGGVAVSG